MRLPLLGEIERENQWNERKERGAQPGLDAGMVELTVERILVRRRGDPVPRRTRLGNDGVGHGSTWARRARSRSGDARAPRRDAAVDSRTSATGGARRSIAQGRRTQKTPLGLREA